MSEAEVLSTDDLRNRMFETLKKRGFVDILKTQLRNRLVAELKDVGLGRTLNRHSEDGEHRSRSSQLYQQAVDSLIAEHLKLSHYNYALSIFLPEAGATQDTLMSVADVLHLLRISSQSKLYKQLVGSESDKGTLWQIISEISMAHGHPTIDTGCQTEATRYPTISTLEEQLAKVDAHYTSMEGTQLLKAGAVEERMLTFQRQLEERYRSELNLAMGRFKENEVTRLQIVEREKRRKEIDKATKEMERTYRAKYDAMAERERHAVEQLQTQQEIAEREMFSQRQKMLDDIEALQQREVQLRRQQEIDNREKSLWEEKVKTKEDLAKRREESARHAEQQHDQRIRDEVTKFKLEEQARYVERLTSVEFREARVKENERRLDDQLQDVSNVKVELIDKRKRVNELEAELIRTRHEFLSAQKQAELLGERTREMIDYQMLKEDNAVMRRELDNTKMRLSELMRDNMVERQKQEDLLREMGVQAGKPSPEVALLRQQVDQLQSRHRTELAIFEQERLQLQQRLEDELARNKDLVMKCEQQTWQQKQFGIEASDLRERLFDSHHAISGHIYRRPSDLDRSASLNDCSDVHPDSDAEHMVQPRTSERLRGSPPYQSEEYSYSSDIVQDTKNRLRRLETEADVLERNYRDFQFRVTSIDPILGPTTTQQAGGIRQGGGDSVHRTDMQPVPFTEQAPPDTADHRTGTEPSRARTAERVTEPSRARTVEKISQPDTHLVVPKSSGLHLFSDQASLRTDRKPLDRDSARLAGSSFYSAGDESVRPSAMTGLGSAANASFTQQKTSKLQDDSLPIFSPIRAQVGDDSVERTTMTPSSSTPQRTALSPPVASSRGSPSTHSAELQRTVDRSASTTADSHSVQESIEPLRISLDDAWKSTTKPASESDADHLKRQAAEQEEFDRQKRRREEERKRLEEEARRKEQQALDELSRKQDSSPERTASHSASVASSKHTASAVNSSAADERDKPDAAQAEPKIDPGLEKYMELVRQQKEKEKQEMMDRGRKAKKDATPVPSDEDISAAEENSESSRTVEKDDFW